jgi:hypothetical protein
MPHEFTRELTNISRLDTTVYSIIHIVIYSYVSEKFAGFFTFLSLNVSDNKQTNSVALSPRANYTD